MKKIVNGEEIEMTPAEVAQRQADDAAWAARHIPTNDEIDQDELNRALASEGSIVRAIAELQFRMIKGQIPTTPTLTPAQYRALLKPGMRTP